MNWLNHRVLRLQVWKDTSGQDLVEYALAVGLVATAAIACIPGLTNVVKAVFSKIGTQVNNVAL